GLWSWTRRKARDHCAQQDRRDSQGRTGEETRFAGEGIRQEGVRDFRRQRRRRAGGVARAGRSGGQEPETDGAQTGYGRRLDAMSDVLARAQRIVVKIGSALLVDRESGQLREAWL